MEAETSVLYLTTKECLESFNPRRNKVSLPDTAEKGVWTCPQKKKIKWCCSKPSSMWEFLGAAIGN